MKLFTKSDLLAPSLSTCLYLLPFELPFILCRKSQIQHKLKCSRFSESHCKLVAIVMFDWHPMQSRVSLSYWYFYSTLKRSNLFTLQQRSARETSLLRQDSDRQTGKAEDLNLSFFKRESQCPQNTVLKTKLCLHSLCLSKNVV